nr:uncharacterized protein CI109_001277 [Kwoniella shandongensis]KAA5530474.1 hypothetical protein CI109_001277 [Kwoniella shandongensis]
MCREIVDHIVALYRCTETIAKLDLVLSFAYASEVRPELGSTLASFVFFATHFHDLAITLGNLPGVTKLHLRTQVNNVNPHSPEFTTTFSYKVVEGPATVQHYGLELAKLAALPPDVLQRATEIAIQLSQLEEQGKGSSKANAMVMRRKTLYELAQLAEDSNVDNAHLGAALTRIQDKCRDTLERCIQIIRSSDDANEYAK